MLSLDATTQGNCLSAKSHFNSRAQWSRHPTQAKRTRHWWFASASRSRWIVTTALCTGTLIAAVVLLVIGMQAYDYYGQRTSAFALGFGAVNTQARLKILSLQRNIVANIMIANSPQLLLSFLYFAYNGLWTCMLLSQEWFSYAGHGKGLRVTSPNNKQRSTYRLQLPYRYGIPLMVMSGLLHWLISQSIFLLNINAYNIDDFLDDYYSYSSCGYSPVAILTTIVVGALVLIVGLANGFRRYPATSMPLATSCSAVISAACHPLSSEGLAHQKVVQWGVCSRQAGEASKDDTQHFDHEDESFRAREPLKRAVEDELAEIGHCSFTSMPVTSPLEGAFYAGNLLEGRDDKFAPSA